MYKMPLKYAVAVIFMVVLLYPKFPLISIPGTFVSIRFEDFLILISVLYLLLFYRPDLKGFLNNALGKSIMFYLLFAFISTLYGAVITKTVTPHIGLLHFLRRIEYFSPLIIGYIAMKHNKTTFLYVIKLLPIIILYIFTYGLGQRYLGWPIIITQNFEYSKGIALRWMEGSHINSTFAGHYDLATFLVFILPILVLIFIKAKKHYIKVVYFTSYLLSLWLLVNSASRISLVSYVFAVFISLTLVKKVKYIVFIVLISVLFSLFSASLVSRYVRFIEVLKLKSQRYISTINFPKSVYAGSFEENQTINFKLISPSPTAPPKFEDRSTSIRLNVEWPRAIRSFYKNPLIGTGQSSITLATDNDYLRLIGESGILGFISFALVIFIVLRDSINYLLRYKVKSFNLMDNYLVAGFIGGFTGVIINAVFIDVFEASKFATVFWMFCGMIYEKVQKYPDPA